ncbi:hypothetical protein N9D08_01795 [bacterium]|jgi:hypothetical protein|nr:hypothetical protein [bacterium]
MNPDKEEEEKGDERSPETLARASSPHIVARRLLSPKNHHAST